MPTEATTHKTPNTYLQDSDYNKKTLSQDGSFKLSGTFGHIPRACSIHTNEAQERQINRGCSAFLGKLDTRLLCRELLKIKIPDSLLLVINNELQCIQKVLDKSIEATKTVMNIITISSSGLRPTTFNIHADRLKVYQKTSLKEAERIKGLVRGKGKLQMDKKTQSAIKSAQGREKEQLLKAWKNLVKSHTKKGWKELETILADSKNNKMGNCEEQANLAIRSLKPEEIILEAPHVNVKMEICNDLFIEPEDTLVIGLVSIYRKKSNQIIARIVMDPWAGHCAAIEEIEQCHPRVKLNAVYRL